LSGCVTHVTKQCPDCVYTDGVTTTPRLRQNVARLFILVPGALGYGWEWDAAVASLRKQHADFIVFWWDPWSSIRSGANHLRSVVQTALWVEPSLKEVILVAHSAGGIVAAHGLAGVAVPPGTRIKLVTIGTPFAGMGAAPVGDPRVQGASDYDDPLGSPAIFAVGGHLHRYPPLPAGVAVVEYTTSWPPDPVMEPRYGWNPAPPGVGPAGARRIPVDPKLDHNFVVARVVDELLSATKSTPVGNASRATGR
jgi:hypothetical protein